MKTKPFDRTAEYRKVTLDTRALGKRVDLVNMVLGTLPILSKTGADLLRSKLMKQKMGDLKWLYNLLK